MQPGTRTSLGAAVLDFPAADGYIAPPACAPDPWKTLLLSRKHTTAVCRQRLRRACPAGTPCLIQHAEHATLTLDGTVPAAQPTDAWLSATQLPTTVVVKVSDRLETRGRVERLLGLLADGRHNIDTLTIRYSPPAHTRFYDRSLQLTWPVLPTVTSLQLDRCSVVLPPPASLPSLTHLGSTAFPAHDHPMLPQIYSSIAALLPQLTACSYYGRVETPSGLFSAAVPLPKLTTLSLTNTVLCDKLLGLLLDSAPALQQLTVSQLHVASDEYSERVWGVEQLCVGRVDTDRLMRVPRPASGGLRIEGSGELSLQARSEEGLDPTILQRLATEWSISYHTITLTPRAAEAEEDLVADQDVALFNNPLALQNALQQIATMQLPPNTTVKLEGWVVAAGFPAVFVAAPPALTRFALNLDLPESVLTDTLLGGLLAMGPRVVRAQLSHTELRTDEHADKPWPWEELLCQGVSVTQVARLPDPGRVKRLLVDLAETTIDHTVMEVGVERICGRLKYIHWSIADGRIFLTLPHPHIHPLDIRDAERTQAAQIQVLNAMHITGEKGLSLVFQNWSMTEGAVRALRDLPAWVCDLEVRGAMAWPLALQPRAYATLVKYLPARCSQL